MQDNEILTAQGVAEFMKLSLDVIYRLVHLEGFPVLRFGRAIHVPKSQLLEWIDNQVKKGEIL